MNERNLITFPERSESEVRELNSKGGKKSGETRRRKRDMKQKMKLLLSLPCADNDRQNFEALGIDPEDMDNEMVLVVAMFLGAASGDTRAFDKVMQILGKDIAHEELAIKKREFKLKEAAAKPNDPGAEEIPMLYKALEDDEE